MQGAAFGHRHLLGIEGLSPEDIKHVLDLADGYVDLNRQAEKKRALLRGPNFYAIATLGKDGGPRSTTIWGHLGDDDLIEVNSREGRGWPSNLRRDPRVAIEVHSEKRPYEQVSIVGHVVEMTTDGAVESINRLSEKYTGNPDYKIREGAIRVRIRIAIDRATSWG